MDVRKIELWLRHRQTRKSLVACGLGLVLLLLSVPAMVLTYAGISITYIMSVTSLTSTFDLLKNASDYTSVVAVSILLLCFPSYLIANHEDLQELAVSSGTACRRVRGSTLNPLAPDSFRSAVKLLTGVLFIAPALFLHGLNQFVRAARLRSLNFPEASLVVGFLASQPHRVAYHTIVNGIPGIDHQRVFSSLAKVDGIVVLVDIPEGLSLNDSLRGELRRL